MFLTNKNVMTLKPGSDGRQGSCHVAMFIHSPPLSRRQGKRGQELGRQDKAVHTGDKRAFCLVPIFLTSCRDEQKVETRNGSCRCRQYWYTLLPLLGLSPFQVEMIFYDHPRE